MGILAMGMFFASITSGTSIRRIPTAGVLQERYTPGEIGREELE